MNKYNEILHQENIIFEKKEEKYVLRAAFFGESSQNLFAKIKDVLSAKELIFYKTIRNEERKIEWLGTRILLKSILGKYSEIFYDENGKPFIKEKKFISVTHSKSYVALIVGTDSRLSADMEFLSDRIYKTAHKFVPAEELSRFPEEEFIQRAYLHWCVKETLYKIKGTGGYDFKKDFVLAPFQIHKEGIVEASILQPAKEDFLLSYIFVCKDDVELLLVWHG